MNQTIAICGFKHVGKTYFGKKVSCELDIPFIDLDEFLSRKYNLDIRQLYQNVKESEFRNLEFLALKEIDFSKKQILALGGGTVHYKKSLSLLLENAHLIAFFCSYEDLKKRILSSDMAWSLLDPKMPEESLKELYQMRNGYLDGLNITKFNLNTTMQYQLLEDYVRQYFR